MTEQPPWSQDVPTDFYLLKGRDDEEFEIYGRLIGYSSSRGLAHSDHPETDENGNRLYAPESHRCSRCRWFEVRIFVVEKAFGDICTCGAIDRDEDACAPFCGEKAPDKRYLLLTYGLSEVPGHIQRRSAYWTNFPYEILEKLVQSGPRGTFLPKTSALAVAQAASCDEGMRYAYKPLLSKLSV